MFSICIFYNGMLFTWWDEEYMFIKITKIQVNANYDAYKMIYIHVQNVLKPDVYKKLSIKYSWVIQMWILTILKINRY